MGQVTARNRGAGRWPAVFGTYMAVDSSAWWPGGLTTANPFCRNKTDFQWSDRRGLLRSPCTKSIMHTQKEWNLQEASEKVFVPPIPFCRMNRNNTRIMFSQIVSQVEGSHRARGRTGVWELYQADKWNISYYPSVIHFQGLVLI